MTFSAVKWHQYGEYRDTVFDENDDVATVVAHEPDEAPLPTKHWII